MLVLIRKINLLLLICIAIAVTSLPLQVAKANTANANAAGNAAPHVLLVYDSMAKGSSRAGNIETLKRLLASNSAQVTLVSQDDYAQGSLQAYTKVIAIHNAADLSVNSVFLDDLNAYKGDYLHIGEHLPAKLRAALNIQTQVTGRETIDLSIGPFGESSIQVERMPYIVQAQGTTYGSIQLGNRDAAAPYAVRLGHNAYVPYFEQGNLSELALAYVLKDWMGVSDQGRTYVVFKEIYPFSDLALLEQLADKLYSAGIPFIASVRPVFYNTDYPAMLRYLETLKYIQSRNGSILVHAPIVATSVPPEDYTLIDKMAHFVNVLADYDIAPLGLGTEMYWSYDERYSDEGMRFFDSAILFPDEKPYYRSRINTSRPLDSALFSMQLTFLQQFKHAGKAIEPLPMDTVLTYDFVDNEAELDEIVQQLSDSWITFADYKYGSHRVQTEKNEIVSRAGQLAINGEPLVLNIEMKSISSDYTYKEVEEKSLEALFNVQNKIFVVLILITLAAFGMFLIIGYRMYKRKYFK